jgi:hypothetical protein
MRELRSVTQGDARQARFALGFRNEPFRLEEWSIREMAFRPERSVRTAQGTANLVSGALGFSGGDLCQNGDSDSMCVSFPRPCRACLGRTHMIDDLATRVPARSFAPAELASSLDSKISRRTTAGTFNA